MKGSFDYLLENMERSDQPFEWEVYHNLINTKGDINKIYRFNWDTISDHPYYHALMLLLIDFENNYNVILNVVKDILLDKIKTDRRFIYTNYNNIEVCDWYLDVIVVIFGMVMLNVRVMNYINFFIN
jgi:hypothetical protein